MKSKITADKRWPILLAILLIVFTTAGNVAAQWATNGNNINNTNTGNVGIGTTSPNQTLTVSGFASSSIGHTAQIIGTASSGTLQNQLNITSSANNWGLILGQNNSGVASSGYHCANCAHVVNVHNAALVFGTNNVDRMRIDGSGNVGIGTAAPGGLLDLASSTQVNNRILLSGQEFFAPGNTSTSGIAIRLGTNRSGERQIWFADSSQAINATNAQLRMRFFSNSASLDAITTDGTDVRPLILQSYAGNVGIGSITTPAVKLAVNGNGVNVYNTDAWVENNIHAQGNETLTQGGRGRLRVGTAWFYTGIYSELSSTGAANDLVLGASSGNVRVGPDSTIVQNFIVPNGNVGIGTATPPSTRLHVVGDVTVTGNISAKYQDVAEWVPARQKLTPGTVVVLDADRGSDVIASSEAYDTKVAGVISIKPGLALGESGEGKVLVATTGRVRVKVDATRAPIRVGDLLVTSDTPGYAMKSEPIVIKGRSIHSPGTLIGKALESLEKGTGEIMVLLSLQ